MPVLTGINPKSSGTESRTSDQPPGYFHAAYSLLHALNNWTLSSYFDFSKAFMHAVFRILWLYVEAWAKLIM